MTSPEPPTGSSAISASESSGVLNESQLIRADWPAPKHIQAWVTTRSGGVSQTPYESLNLGHHVHDQPSVVAQNRQRLTQFCQARGSIGELQWLNQVHGTAVYTPVLHPSVECPEADASTSAQVGLVLAVMTADCLPVFFTDSQGQRVAVAHAGWRGLCQGILEATAATFAVGHPVMAWLGPAIGPQSFEVGASVRTAFLAAATMQELSATQAAFVAHKPGHYLADLYALARLRLQRAGVQAVYGGGFDTVSESSRFFSYRRESLTGRMASVIWQSASR